MTTHTPGPWYPYLDRLGGRHVSSGQIHVATIGSIFYPLQADIDARLIAAAPELLVALKGMLDIYDRYTGVGLPEADAARAVINKIERET